MNERILNFRTRRSNKHPIYIKETSVVGPIHANHRRLATNVCQPGVSQGFALLTESLLTFLFVFVVLGATSRFGNSSLAGVAIGLALGLVNIVGIPVDNCSVNPARSFGPALFSANAWPDFWIMVAGPLIGAVLAAIAWRLVAPCCCKKPDSDVTVKED